MGYTLSNNWTGFKIKTAPTLEPVTASDVRAQLRLDDETQDDMINVLIKAARQAVEVKTKRTLIKTVYQLYYEKFPSYEADKNQFQVYPYQMELLRFPIISVDSIKYYDTDGTLTTLSATEYTSDLVSVPARVTPAYGKSWPSTRDMVNAVVIEYSAGYGTTAASVPEALRQAIIMLVCDLFEHPEANVEVKLEENRALNFLLASYTLGGVY